MFKNKFKFVYDCFRPACFSVVLIALAINIFNQDDNVIFFIELAGLFIFLTCFFANLFILAKDHLLNSKAKQ